MDVDEGLDKLKKLQEMAAEIKTAAESYQRIGGMLALPLETRIEGGRAPIGYGDSYNITERPRPLEELQDLLFQIQSLYSDLDMNYASIPDENVKSMIATQMSNVFPQTRRR